MYIANRGSMSCGRRRPRPAFAIPLPPARTKLAPGKDGRRGSEDAVMANYILLASYSEQGLKAIRTR